ncbi:hypothetical protein B9Q13_03335 [Candidatus Marsarchaeota G2 archaeon ECH_B_SAG-G16]|uniref:Uncharacterized protein n=1 Tax=Candidatus Marsarchaeota G2 archaeon ECH_B_SAG-G16 TaxID=1978167 RepID=A0A2R6C1Z4_9ARCH|nr:MAG: hypothetical protein B9Q13_03335 [Candidatus Marsarchaeota G2 archaeon ECH_B_SAG-G16]
MNGVPNGEHLFEEFFNESIVTISPTSNQRAKNAHQVWLVIICGNWVQNYTMSKNELRQLALDLRKQNPEFQLLHSQVTQQVA